MQTWITKKSIEFHLGWNLFNINRNIIMITTSFTFVNFSCFFCVTCYQLAVLFGWNWRTTIKSKLKQKTKTQTTTKNTLSFLINYRILNIVLNKRKLCAVVAFNWMYGSILHEIAFISQYRAYNVNNVCKSHLYQINELFIILPYFFSVLYNIWWYWFRTNIEFSVSKIFQIEFYTIFFLMKMIKY